MKSNMKWLTGFFALILAAVGVFAAGGALDIPKHLGVMASLDSTMRGASAFLAISAIGLSLRLWLKAFGIETSTGLSENQ